jgi:outer membrane protein OmpA-like peptidoglycan-associated protein
MWITHREIALCALAGAICGALLFGCATTEPAELVVARSAYRAAAQGPASELAPAELHKASESLARAEQAYADHAEPQSVADLAYVAQRKAQLADALGREAMDTRNKSQAERDYQTAQAERDKRAQRELASTRDQVAQLGTQLGQAEKARVDAEAALLKLIAAKEESRGLVITLSGSVLFAFNEAALLPDARARLDQVADALLGAPDRSIVVEGYTDSRGSDSFNLDLSQRRAEAVREYLVGRGVVPDLIRAQGFGKARPIADNNTPEGRANNRRVEIVLPQLGRPAPRAIP